MAEGPSQSELDLTMDDGDCIRHDSSHDTKGSAHQCDDDEVFHHTEKVTSDENREKEKQCSASDSERKARARERRQLRHSSSHGSHDHSAEHDDSITKTELIRASAKRAQTERHRKSSNENVNLDIKHKPSRAGSSSVRNVVNNSHKKTHSRRQSSFNESHDQRRTSPRSSQRNGSVSPGGRVSPKRSLSTSPKHQGNSGTNSKTSLLTKPSTSMASSPQRSFSDVTGQSGVTTSLLPRTQVNSTTHSYSKPAMEVAVSALVFLGGLVTLIVALIIGSKAWIIVGSISMGIGGVFIGFGFYFHMSRRPPLLGTEERLEIQLVDAKQLAELSCDGFKVDL